MSNPYDEDEVPYPDNLLPAFTPVNRQPRSAPANPAATYRPNPTFRPPHREPVRHNVYDIPDIEDAPSRPTPKKARGGRPAVPTTPLSLSKTTTPPDSKKQMRKTSQPNQAKSTKSFPNTTVSKANISQNRSNSINDKFLSNRLSSAPAAKESMTAMQFGIAMTTMQKLAAFRYQPSSTGSVHKAMAPSFSTLKQHIEHSTEDQARSHSATLFSMVDVVQEPGNDDYEPCQDSRTRRDSRSQTYDTDLNRSHGMRDSPYECTGTSVLAIASQNAHGLSNSVFSNARDAYSGAYDTASKTARDPTHSMTESFSDTASLDVDHGEMRSESFFASTLSNAAALPTAPSSTNVDEGNNLYDEGLKHAGLCDMSFSEDPICEPVPFSSVEEHIPGNEALLDILLQDQGHHYHEPLARPDDDMLDFDELTAQPWNHMDYAAHAGPDGDIVNDSKHTEEGFNHTDPNAAQDVQQMQSSNADQPDATNCTDAETEHVYSNNPIANPEIATESYLPFHDQTTVPGEDNEDYFAALEDFDDEDLKHLPVPSTMKEAKKMTPPGLSNIVDKPMPQDEDYLAALGDFNDEDFMDVEILVPSGHKEAVQNHSDLMNPAPTVEKPAIRYHQPAQDNHLPHKSMLNITSSLTKSRHNGPGTADDDEYPLDEEEQAELEHLGASKHDVVMETNEPPSSIFHSEEDMRDMEIYDRRLKYSPVVPDQRRSSTFARKLQENQIELDEPLTDPENWEFLRGTRVSHASDTATTLAVYTNLANAQKSSEGPGAGIVDDEDYHPLPPFARPPFPGKVPGRSPVTGINSNLVLRTCFRIGEALSQASLCSQDNQDAVTELFARVTFSARETDGKKQNFQFGDIFHSKPPFVSGVLEKYAARELQQTESSEMITVGKEKRDGEQGEMVRVLGRVKRVVQGRGYTMEIINIRKTDWEEIRFTKRILGA